MIKTFCNTCKNHEWKPERKCKVGFVLNPYVWGCADLWEPLMPEHTVKRQEPHP
jgi:hypothetical protein